MPVKVRVQGAALVQLSAARSRVENEAGIPADCTAKPVKATIPAVSSLVPVVPTCTSFEKTAAPFSEVVTVAAVGEGWARPLLYSNTNLFAVILPFDFCPGMKREATRSPVCMLT